MRALGLMLVLAASPGGCNCRPEIPPSPTESDDTDSRSTADSFHSAMPAGPCDVPEIEPNDTPAQATELPVELHACGTYDDPGDLDLWRFDLPVDAWLLARLQASDGSVADPALLLTPADGSWAAVRANDPESVDATLRFPAPAGTYELTVSEEQFKGGERYGYDVLVSESKAPVGWTRAEVEPNDDQGHAELVTDGDAIFGTMSGNGPLPDYDWYQVQVPPGKHTLTVDISAFDEGSAADLTIYLYDAGLHQLPEGCEDPCPRDEPACIPCAIKGGIAGVELDPHGAYVSDGGEVLWIQVLEDQSREGPAHWYVLDIGLEGA